MAVVGVNSLLANGRAVCTVQAVCTVEGSIVSWQMVGQYVLCRWFLVVGISEETSEVIPDGSSL